MNTKFQIQIKTHNWEGDSPTITKEITLNDLTKFTNLVELINKNSGNQTWNWFGKGHGLPTVWDGTNYVLDFYNVCRHMKINFGYEVEDINLVKEFFLRFTPNGCDGIEWIKFFKVEEIVLNKASELEDNKDEKIRKTLYGLVCVEPDDTFKEGFTKEQILAWIEKQGKSTLEANKEEKDNANKIELKDYSSIDPHFFKTINKVEPKFKVGDKIIEKDFYECGCGTIIDIKDGKYIFDNGEFIYIEEQDLWKLVEQKSAWSEEDSMHLTNAILAAEKEWGIESCTSNWLKSLRPQPQWKPSDEQLKSLQEVIDVGHFTSYPNSLETLYEQLKKLMEE